MGSDYHYQTVERYELMAGVLVPVAEGGYHLDPDDIRVRNGVTEARELTSPYGALHYAVGYSEPDDEGDESPDDESSGDWERCFDYAELPDGRIILHAVDNSESGGYIEGYAYEVVSKDEAPARAMEMVEDALETICLHGREHDEEGWNQDPYYFVRSVMGACGIEPYASAPYNENRRGDIPNL
jgi:hypothetical protein